MITTIITIAGAVGIPSLCSALVIYVVKATKKNIKSQKGENEAVKRGIQSMLRNELLKEYKIMMAQGYAEYDDKQNWMNMYEQYHNLGQNGIMDSYKDKLLEMPDRKET